MHRKPKQTACHLMTTIALLSLVVCTGCQKSLWNNGIHSAGLFKKDQINFDTMTQASDQIALRSSGTVQERLAAISNDEPPVSVGETVPNSQLAQSGPHPTTTNSPSVAASPPSIGHPSKSAYRTSYIPQDGNSTVVRAQSPGNQDPMQDNQFSLAGGTVQQDEDGEVKKVAYQYPELATPDRILPPGNRLNSPNVGSPNELNPLVQPDERGGNVPFPANYADLDVYVTETQTGRINFGGAYNSDNGIVGQFTIDEKNFDITRWPRSFREIVDGTAWRGAGQAFRLELVPGNNLERYLVSFSEPYMLGTDYSFSVSGYLFSRQYFDWDERRLGGRIAIGRRLTPDLSISSGIRMESVTVDNPRLTTSPELNASLGSSNLFLANVGLIRDTRDSPFQATEGSYTALTFSQAFGDYSYSRGDIDIRRYKLMYERPDGSGRHTVSFGSKLGFSGASTPIFENYFAGGFSTMRGFDFRGASPVQNGVRVGGEFQWLNTLEYMFPLTADDMIKAVLFCDFGTVEEKIEINADNFRVAPGFGFRVQMPAAGIGAPLAFDFAFPVASANGDQEKVFSFYLGVLR